MSHINDPGTYRLDDGKFALSDRQKGLDLKSRGGQATKEARDKPRPSEVFDWDKALRLNRQTRREIYGA